MSTEKRQRFAYFRGNKAPKFATETERQAAELLEFYRIAWEYEPRTFVLERDEEGNIKEAFTPDFYLPDLDLYLEVTQMKQALVTPKHRKIRRLRELHPDVRIKILHKKDFVQLAKKFGLVPPM